MNTRHDPSHPPFDRDDDGDRALKEALAAMPAPVDAGRIEALQQRVLSQWQDTHRAESLGGGAAAWLSGWGARRTWFAGATGLALGLALLVGTWLRAPDPSIDDLLQPDVLSQMAAGEM